jgi:crotonobetaine/carnitine-CoA ligase
MYSEVHDPRQWVLPAVIDEQANVRGDQRFATMVGGASLTYRELRDDAAQVAGLLESLGLGRGDRVAIMLPSGLDFIRAWAGIGRLGATAVMLNVELAGSFLAHPIVDSAPQALIIDAAYLPALADIRAVLPAFKHVLVAGASPNPGGIGGVAFDEWRSAPATDAPMPGASDLACIMYTSGTTGPPKGVLMPHAHCFLFGLGVVENLGIEADDHYYVCLPLSHANGLLMQLGATLIVGAQATVRGRFSASSWLQDLRDCGATVTHSLGAISAFVIAQPPSGHDRDHRLRLICSAPNHPDHELAWRERFGIREIVGGYGMTEVNIPVYGDRHDPRPGTCGRPYDKYFQVEVRDPVTDFPVARGEVGEIMVRPRVAQGFMAGYNDLPAKTVEAWRNLWFHSGDAGRMDEDGYITFVDRMKDCIRRRGENISATDIEASFLDLPGIVEIAAFAVPSSMAGGEDEIMLAIVLHPDRQVSAREIFEHAKRKIPRFAQPRYVEFMRTLPKTASEKVRKAELRNAGVTPDTIDLTSLDGKR